MTELRVLARARKRGSRVDIYFDADGATNQGRYRPGDLLLTLKRRHKKFWLRWGILKPDGEEKRKAARAERLPATCSGRQPVANMH
jgi:hypothetical protein